MLMVVYGDEKLKVSTKIERICGSTKMADLYHARMITGEVSRPWSAILHNPSLFWFLLSLRHQRVDPHLELFVFPLPQITTKFSFNLQRKPIN